MSDKLEPTKPRLIIPDEVLENWPNEPVEVSKSEVLEPTVKQESQEELFREALSITYSPAFVESAMNSKDMKKIMKLFTITRRNP